MLLTSSVALTTEANSRVLETVKNAATLQAKLQAAEARVKELEAQQQAPK